MAKKYKTQNQNAGGFHKMNQKILKRLDNAISSTLIGKSKDPDCNVGAAISVIHKGQADRFRLYPGCPDGWSWYHSITAG